MPASQAPYLYSAERLASVAQLADAEFALMRRCGVNVAPTEWHITTRDGRARLVARVAVIEGVRLYSLAQSPRHAEYEAYIDSIGAYQTSTAPGDRIFDMSPVQFQVGEPRPEPNAPTALYDVDIEPIFWTP